MIKSQFGFSLVEILVGMSLGLLLMSSFMEVYLSVKTTFKLQTGLAYIQDNGRYAAYFLTTTLHKAGNDGCQAQQHKEIIKGYSKNPPAFLAGQTAKDSSILAIYQCDFSDKQPQYLPTWLFIGDTKRKNAAGNIIYALYEITDQHRKELVENIQAMQILYGIAKPASPAIEQYLPADQVTHWQWVRSVKIALLLSSQEPVLSASKVYSFDNKLWPKDNYLHKEWDLYIALRNTS